MYGFKYKDLEVFWDKKVVCMGFGESGIGISFEISSVVVKIVVVVGNFNFVFWVYFYSNKFFD